MNRFTVLLVAVVACNSGPSKPSNEEVTTAVQTMVDDERLDYFSLSKLADGEADDYAQCGVGDGDRGKLKSLSVTGVEYVAYNVEKKYWPAKLSLAGVCVKQVPNCGDTKNELCPPEDSQFQLKGLQFGLQQDDFQKWSVVPLR